jgi:hypothetical protein
MQKIYRIKLSREERNQLEALTHSSKKIAAKKLIKARSLLLADESEQGPAWSDPNIIEATGITPTTLSRLRQRVCEDGPFEALERRPQQRPSRERKVTGDVDARISAIACSEAPEGYKRWTLTLIADRIVELEILDSISYESVRQSLKKTLSNPG